jgi:hypothetical protein
MASSDQSIEVIRTNCDSMTDCSDLFSNHFNEPLDTEISSMRIHSTVLNSADENWLIAPTAAIQFTAQPAAHNTPVDLMKMTTTSGNRDFGADIKLVTEMDKMTVGDMPELPANSKKRKQNRNEEESKENVFQFESVIKSIQQSNNGDWLSSAGKKYREAPRIENSGWMGGKGEQVEWLASQKKREEKVEVEEKKEKEEVKEKEKEKELKLNDKMEQDDWLAAKKHYESYITLSSAALSSLSPTPATPTRRPFEQTQLQPQTTISPVTIDDLQEVVSKQKRYWYPTNDSGQQSTATAAADDYWLMKNPQTKDAVNRPTNQMAQNVATWESILGWQAVLEKIHASGDDDWLVPASRNGLK